MLWFSAPPLNVSRIPPAKHSLAYLHFLAMKRKREEQKDGEGEQATNNENGDGGGGEDQSDLGANKRPKVENEVRLTTREMMQKLWVEMKMDI